MIDPDPSHLGAWDHLNRPGRRETVGIDPPDVNSADRQTRPTD
jgi:hypothetical protein